MLGSSRAVFLSHADRRLIATALLLIYALANAASCAASELSADPADTGDQQVVIPSVANTNATTESTSFSPLFAPVSRVYIAPIIGPSWATLSRSVEDEKLSSSNGNLFTAGGAFGFTIPFEKSQCRIEIEPRYRDSFTVLKNNELGASSFRTGDNWSVLTNAWCDFGVTDRLGLYAGGGLGSGGYSVNLAGVTHDGDAVLVGNGKVAAFAWQVGGGAVFALNDRIHLDIGCRFYSVPDGQVPITGYVFGDMVSSSMNTSFTASELVFSLRIYEPFSRWVR